MLKLERVSSGSGVEWITNPQFFTTGLQILPSGRYKSTVYCDRITNPAEQKWERTRRKKKAHRNYSVGFSILLIQNII
jgi:hypothetical protein